MKQINLIYYSVFFLWYLLSLLPLRFLYFISDLLFYPLYYCIRYRRKIIRNNLSNSFPEKDLKEIVQIEKQFYSFFCDYIVETLKLFSISKKQLMRRMTFEGLDEIVHPCLIGFPKTYPADKSIIHCTIRLSTNYF